MPKLKTNKTTSKRVVRITGGGKLLRRNILSQHLVARKSRRTIKASGEKKEFSPAEEKKLRKIIPYRTK